MRTASTSKAALEVVRPCISDGQQSILETIGGTLDITTGELAAKLELDLRRRRRGPASFGAPSARRGAPS